MVSKCTLLETVVKVLKISTEIYGQSVLECPIYKVNILELRRRNFIMKRYGYHRTSTREQHLDRGIKEITAYCEQNNRK